MLEILKQWTLYLAAGIETTAAIVIGVATIEATIAAFALFVRPNPLPAPKETLRLRLGRWLALALEFEQIRVVCRHLLDPDSPQTGLCVGARGIGEAI